MVIIPLGGDPSIEILIKRITFFVKFPATSFLPSRSATVPPPVEIANQHGDDEDCGIICGDIAYTSQSKNNCNPKRLTDDRPDGINRYVLNAAGFSKTVVGTSTQTYVLDTFFERFEIWFGKLWIDPLS